MVEYLKIQSRWAPLVIALIVAAIGYGTLRNQVKVNAAAIVAVEDDITKRAEKTEIRDREHMAMLHKLDKDMAKLSVDFKHITDDYILGRPGTSTE